MPRPVRYRRPAINMSFASIRNLSERPLISFSFFFIETSTRFFRVSFWNILIKRRKNLPTNSTHFCNLIEWKKEKKISKIDNWLLARFLGEKLFFVSISPLMLIAKIMKLKTKPKRKKRKNSVSISHEREQNQGVVANPKNIPWQNEECLLITRPRRGYMVTHTYVSVCGLFSFLFFFLRTSPW